MKPENRPKIKFEGREYDEYHAAQKQRQIKRTVRKLRRRKTAFEAAGLTEDAQAAKIRLRRLNQEYKAFSKAAGLPEQRERMRVLYSDGSREKRFSTRPKSGIIKGKGYKCIPITEEAIRRVPQIQPDGWGADRTERLQEAHRDLLRAVKDKPVGTDAGAIYTPDMRLIERKIGDAAAQQIVMPRCQEPHVLLHNHPSGEIFSHTDIAPFAMNENMQALTVVGNSGNVYMLVKTNDYDGFRFLQAYNAVLKQLMDAINESNIGKYMTVMEEFLERVEAYGAQFIKRG